MSAYSVEVEGTHFTNLRASLLRRLRRREGLTENDMMIAPYNDDNNPDAPGAVVMANTDEAFELMEGFEEADAELDPSPWKRGGRN